MGKTAFNESIEVFATTPQSSDVERSSYLQRVIDVARWSENAGCKGTLVYTDNRLVDPWLIAQVIIQNTTSLCPLVAIQPLYMHPYAVAKMVATLGHLYGRQVYLNMLAGGFKNDLESLNDGTPHDRRYARMTEYTNIIRQLLANTAPVNFSGEFYTVKNLKLTPSLPKELFPGVLVSGSSEAGLAAARAVGATAVQYPKPAREYHSERQERMENAGIRVGIIARESNEAAWAVAHARFPEDRKGRITHQLAMKVSDSQWHRQLSHLGEETKDGNTVYWLHPFETYKTFCPYLVGDYGSVAEEIANYVSVGYKTFILDIPPSEEELRHINVVFQEASKHKVS
jgi:alkanesulfonate monooxygenase